MQEREYFTEEVYKNIERIMITNLMRSKKYTIERSREIAAELVSEMRGSALRIGYARDGAKQMFENPLVAGRRFVNEAIVWKNTEKGQSYWSTINGHCLYR